MNIKDESDDTVLFTLGIFGLVVICLGALLLAREQSLRCIELIKDKPAAETKAVCA
jgi:hypothetical protein